MPEKYVGPYKDAAQDWLKRRRALVPTSLLPQSLRVVSALPALDIISAEVARQEANREQNQQLLDEARSYVPPFAKEIFELLQPVFKSLGEANVDLQNLDAMQVLQDVSKEKVTIIRETGTEQISSFGEQVKDRRRRLQTILHPDTADRIVEETVDAKKRTELFSQTTEATEAEQPNSDTVNLNFVRTMTSYVGEVIKRGLTEGKTPDQILEQHPDLLTQIGDALYLSTVYMPLGKFDQAFLDPKVAEQEAEKMKQRDELRKGNYAMSGIFLAYAGVATYALGVGVNDITDIYFRGFAGALLEIGGYMGGITHAKEEGTIRDYHDYSVRFRIRNAEEGIRAIAQKLNLLAQAFITSGPNSPSSQDALRDIALEAYRTTGQLKGYVQGIQEAQMSYVSPRGTQRTGQSGESSDFSEQKERYIISSLNNFKSEKNSG